MLQTFFSAGFLLLRGFRFLSVFSISGLCFSGVLLTWCCGLGEADSDCLENSWVSLGRTSIHHSGCCLWHVWISSSLSSCDYLYVARSACSTLRSPIEFVHHHPRTRCPTVYSPSIQRSHADQVFQTSRESIASCSAEIQCWASGHRPQPLQLLYPCSKW